MEKEKSGNGIVIVLVLLVIVLSVLCVLFATKTITLNTKEETKQDEKKEEKETKVDNEKIYEAVIKDYKDALTKGSVADDPDTGYQYANGYAIFNYYYNENNKPTMQYAFYDINKDGNDEMIITSNGNIIDIYGHNDNNILLIMKDNRGCLGERCQIDNIYDNGLIEFSGSGGATVHGIDFYTINSNNVLETINSYVIIYNDENSYTIYDGKTYDYSTGTGTKAKYTTTEELIADNVKDAKQIDLTKLDWKSFN